MLICAITMMASPVEPEQARIVALNFMMQKSPAVTRSTDCTLAYTWSNDRSTTLFYVYNVGGGFVIVAADDAVTPVLGYSTTGSFNPQNIPANCAAWLQGYADQIAYVREHNLSAPERVSQAWTDLVEGREPVRSGNSRSIAPLLTTTWNQSPYYNELCPGEGDDQALTGCVATAMAQIINYYEYPAHGFGTHRYNHDTYGDLSVDYEHTAYRYDLMPDELDWNTPAEQVNAVATLMRDCGVAVNMNYGANESAASDNAARTAFITQFGYDAHWAVKSYKVTQYGGGMPTTTTITVYPDSVWTEMVKAELDEQNPVFYSGSGTFWGASSGHAFVCDGYDADNYFHFNFGWGGSYDGYFILTNITTSDYEPGSIFIGGPEAAGFSITSGFSMIAARPAENTNTLLFNCGGNTTRTVSEPVRISHANGLNNYSCVNFSNNYQNYLTLYPANEGDQLKLDVLARASNFNLTVYDGEDSNGELLAENPETGANFISTSGALTLYLSTSLRCDDLLLQVEPISCVPLVQNMMCLEKSHQSASLSWEVLQRDLFLHHAFNWQLEYGPQGFEPGTGTILNPDDTTALLTGLEAGTYYDAYLSYTCMNGETITLEPFTFRTAYMADCFDVIGNGTATLGWTSSGNYQKRQCVSQQIFTAAELAASGLSAGDAPSTIWVQFPYNPDIRTVHSCQSH